MPEVKNCESTSRDAIIVAEFAKCSDRQGQLAKVIEHLNKCYNHELRKTRAIETGDFGIVNGKVFYMQHDLNKEVGE